MKEELELIKFEVSVNAVHDVLAAQSVMVEPVSEKDWEILELNAEYLEHQILNQINIIFSGIHYLIFNPCR